jgi:hypothetical protein
MISICSNPLASCEDDPTANDKALIMAKHNPKEPEECWIHDNLYPIGQRCLESGCVMFQESVWHSKLHGTRQGWHPMANLSLNLALLEGEPGSFTHVWEPYDCKLPLYSDDMITQCMQG